MPYLALIPLMILANGGSTLLWHRQIQHLIYGNAIIGTIEAAFIAWLFRARFLWLLPAMVCANYFSTLVAWRYKDAAFAWLDNQLLEPSPFENLGRYVAAILLLAFIESVVLEWPFVLAAFHGQSRRFSRSLLACFLAHLVSYTLLVPFYWSASINTIGREVQLVSKPYFAVDKKATVLFIGNDQNIYSIRLDGSPPVLFQSFPSGAYRWTPGFFLRQATTGRWDLWASRIERGVTTDTNRLLIADAFADSPTMKDHADRLEARLDLRPATPEGWDVEDDPYHRRLAAGNYSTGEHFRVQIDLPGFASGVSHITVLPGDQVVFQFGERRIFVCDLNSHRMAPLAEGQCPIVILGDAASPQSTTQPSK